MQFTFFGLQCYFLFCHASNSAGTSERYSAMFLSLLQGPAPNSKDVLMVTMKKTINGILNFPKWLISWLDALYVSV